MLELIYRTFKQNRAIFLGIIILLMLVGLMIGLFKKVPIQVIEINPKEIYREQILSEIASALAGKKESMDQLIRSMDEEPKKMPEKTSENPENSFQNPFQQKSQEPIQEQSDETQSAEPAQKEETKADTEEKKSPQLPGGIDQQEILQIEKTPFQKLDSKE